MLKLAGEQILPEKFGCLIYSPDKQDTTDLEAGTATIVPTSRPATGAAQYSRSLTLAKPADARLEVLRLCARLSVNVTSLGTATHLYLSVRVDVDDSDHELFSEDWTSTGAKLDAVDLHATSKAVLFNLLKDGAAHTYYFCFWADAASQAQLDVVQLWLGVGTCGTTGAPEVVKLNHAGFFYWMLHVFCQGTGAVSLRNRIDNSGSYAQTTQVSNQANYLSMVASSFTWCLVGTVATDLNYVVRLTAAVRSEI